MAIVVGAGGRSETWRHSIASACERLLAAHIARRRRRRQIAELRALGPKCVEGYRYGLFRDHICRPRRRPRHLADQALTLSIDEEKGRLHWQPAPTSS
jgi:hypothetical protein